MRCGMTTTVRPGSELTTWSWCGVSGRPARSESRKRTRSLDWSQVAFWLALFTCSSLFGLFVGGYVGYMENATPHGGTPASLAQLATSDGQWVAMMRQSRAASHRPSDSAAQSARESRLQRLIERAAADSGSDVLIGTPSLESRDWDLVRFHAAFAGAAQKTVVNP
jgi:hypothetical protein